jgi:hypothetical protein
MSLTLRAAYSNYLAKHSWSTGVLAGIAGGIAEVAWILLYGRVFGVDAAVVADGVTWSLFPGYSGSPLAVPLGIAIHMGLAIVLGMAIAIMLARFWPRLSGTAFEAIVVVGLLVAIWAMNFFLVLPILNPSFVELVPNGASLTSKVLFGVAAAFVLQFRRESRPANQRA